MKPKPAPIQITEKNIPLCCPLPDQSAWNLHPRVYLPIEEAGGKVMCSYCSQEYFLKPQTT